MTTSANPLATLRQFVRPKKPAERCDLCGTALGGGHPHLVELDSRKLICSCIACAILFSARGTVKYRRVPERIRFLRDFQMTDAQWESLLIPINLAFFMDSTAAKKVIALYPSPAGSTESLLSLESWDEIVSENPVLHEMEPDVEALLVNRVGSARDYFLAPIDHCYQLVGLIRMHWRGLSGGAEVWEEIGRFFTQLKERSCA